MLTNLLDLDNNLSIRDVHKEEKSSDIHGRFEYNNIIQYCFLSTVFVSLGQLLMDIWFDWPY